LSTVTISDHHLPGPVLPQATVHVNPSLPGSGFGSRALAGVGVAFYVLAALARELGRPATELTEFLDLVALGTVADVVPLDRNNRILVEQGLRRIRAGRTLPGIRALCAVARRPLDSLVASDLGFFVGPRLNAAGRLTDMSVGIECLLADDEARAHALAAELDRLNAERREIEARMQAEAERILVSLRFDEAGAALPLGLCLYDRGWHSGVVGLVASRVKDRVHRPVIAFAPGEDGTARGSARSVPGVHVRDVLEAVATAVPGLIDRFGGHAMAAGLTLAEDRIREFSVLFAAEVARRAEPSMLTGAIVTDGALEPAQMTLATAASLRSGGPWGAAFPEPSFDGVFSVLEAREVGEGHAKLTVRAARGAPPLEAIAFNWLKRTGRVLPRPGSEAELVYRLDVNEYQGIRRLQLLVDELAPRP
jgi:single-stranded-DNA-specific exonuclease